MQNIEHVRTNRLSKGLQTVKETDTFERRPKCNGHPRESDFVFMGVRHRSLSSIDENGQSFYGVAIPIPLKQTHFMSPKMRQRCEETSPSKVSEEEGEEEEEEEEEEVKALWQAVLW